MSNSNSENNSESNSESNSENEDYNTIVEHDLIRLRGFLGDSRARADAAEFGRPVTKWLRLNPKQIKGHLKTLRKYLFDDVALPEGFPKNAEKSLKKHFDRLDEAEKVSFKEELDHVIAYGYQNNNSNNSNNNNNNNNASVGGRRHRKTRKQSVRRFTRQHRVARRSRRARKN